MENASEMVAAIVVPLTLLIGLPWLIFHYVTKWKSKAVITREDEDLLDQLHEIARRCDERLCTIERIMDAENPNWRAVACDPARIGIEDSRETKEARDTIRRIK